MKRELAMAWADELESGHHPQARKYLQVLGVGKCCLGVACWMTPDLKAENDQAEDGQAIKRYVTRNGYDATRRDEYATRSTRKALHPILPCNGCNGPSICRMGECSMNSNSQDHTGYLWVMLCMSFFRRYAILPGTYMVRGNTIDMVGHFATITIPTPANQRQP
jgi:hypothetical protein